MRRTYIQVQTVRHTQIKIFLFFLCDFVLLEDQGLPEEVFVIKKLKKKKKNYQIISAKNKPWEIAFNPLISAMCRLRLTCITVTISY